jgi:chromosome segregation ATPase
LNQKKKAELDRIRKEIEELQNVNKDLQLRIMMADQESQKLRENEKILKESLNNFENSINLEEVSKLKAVIDEKTLNINEVEGKVKACEAIIKKMKEITDKLIKENRECRENLRVTKEELTRKQSESAMKSKMLESVDIKLGTGMIELLRVHRTFMDELQLKDRPIVETLKRYMEIQLKMRNGKDKAEKIIKERWPLMFDEWDSYRRECGLLDSLLFLVQIAN